MSIKISRQDGSEDEFYTKAERTEKLKDVPDDGIIFVEGCDCWGPWNGQINKTSSDPDAVQPVFNSDIYEILRNHEW